MPRFTFDIPSTTTVYVEAATEEEAQHHLGEFNEIECEPLYLDDAQKVCVCRTQWCGADAERVDNA